MLKKITLSLAVMSSFIACDTKSNSANNAPAEEEVDIAFIKEGDLTLSNNDSIIKNLDIEVAKTSVETQIGLMNRNSLGENEGMIFIFDGEKNTGFWMKDTRIPLDIIFIGQDSTVISVQENAKPYDQTNLPAKAPYRYVLEVNGGKAQEWGVVENVTKVHWKELSDR